MTRFFSIVMVSQLILSATALADHGGMHMGTPEQQRACRPDVLRYCRNVQGGDFAIADCLRANKQKLTAACRRVFEGTL